MTMKKPLLVKYVLPFFQWYALMILIAIAIDYFLHRLNLVWVGRYLGLIGTLFILVSLTYSLRKRKLIEYGSPKQLLKLHENLSWIGSIMLLVHAGIHFNALLPWLAVLMLLITVASGLVGKFLLKKANEALKERKQDLINTGITIGEVEKILHFDSITVDLMKKWRVVHLPITLILGILSLMHVVTVIMFGK